MHAAALAFSHCLPTGQTSSSSSSSAEAPSSLTAALPPANSAGGSSSSSSSSSSNCHASAHIIASTTTNPPLAAHHVSTNHPPNIPSPFTFPDQCPVHGRSFPQHSTDLAACNLPPSSSQSDHSPSFMASPPHDINHSALHYSHDWASMAPPQQHYPPPPPPPPHHPAGQPQDSHQDGYIDPRRIHNGGLSFSNLSFDPGNISLPTSAAASPYLHHASTPHSCPETSASPFPDATHAADDAEHDANAPYNQLLYRCLLEAPHHELLLKDIYKWFLARTDKGRDPKSKGWQNSIRHNLSMNPAFIKGSRSQPENGTTNMWSLTDRALDQGVEPTTRFRNSNHRPMHRARTVSRLTPGAIRTTRSTGRPHAMDLYGQQPLASEGPRSTPMPTAAVPYDYCQYQYGQPVTSPEELFDTVGTWQSNAMRQAAANSPYFGLEQHMTAATPYGMPSTGPLMEFGACSDARPTSMPHGHFSALQPPLDPQFLQQSQAADTTPWSHVNMTGGQQHQQELPTLSEPNQQVGETITGFLPESRDAPLFASDNESTSSSDHGPKTPLNDTNDAQGMDLANAKQLQNDDDFQTLFNSPHMR